MQKSFIVPLALFMLVVFAFIMIFGFSSISQTIRNAQWQAQNSQAVQVANTTQNFIPGIIGCGGGFIFFIFIFISTMSGKSDYGSFSTYMDIGKQYVPSHVDENGRFIAYRRYRKIGVDKHGHPLFFSMYRSVLHRGGYLKADKKPTENNSSGIYAMKRPDDPQLSEMIIPGQTALVEVRLWGNYVEGTRGYRAEECLAIRVLKED
jgi:hypothetical protein